MFRNLKKLKIDNSLLYFLVVCLFIVGLASIRSAPVYGKLDFLLIDNKPWWPEWEGVIEDTLNQGDSTVLTDPTTGTVLNGVFKQKTLYFRKFRPARFIDVDNYNFKNRPFAELMPWYTFPLLLKGEDSLSAMEEEEQQNILMHSKVELSFDDKHDESSTHPYRCLINLHGFAPTWVSKEVGHWLPVLSNTAIWYHRNGTRGRTLREYLRTYPLDNCTVFF